MTHENDAKNTGYDHVMALTASELHWYREGHADALIWVLQNLDLSPEDAIRVEEITDDGD